MEKPFILQDGSGLLKERKTIFHNPSSHVRKLPSTGCIVASTIPREVIAP